MQLKNQKGFTIIELIVVIAIIAVLATIVLVNVTQYINKSKDAAIEGNMDTILTNAAAWFDTTGNYTDFPGNVVFTGPGAAITAAGGTVTPEVDSASAFCAYVTLHTGDPYCVDSTGYKGATNNCASGHDSCN